MENIDISFGPRSKKSKEARVTKRYCPGCNKGVEAKLITNAGNNVGTYVLIKHHKPGGGVCPYSHSSVPSSVS